MPEDLYEAIKDAEDSINDVLSMWRVQEEQFMMTLQMLVERKNKLEKKYRERTGGVKHGI